MRWRPGASATRRREPEAGPRRKIAQAGQMMVEMALILPVFLMILFAIWDFGSAYQHYLTLQTAVAQSLDQAETGASNVQVQTVFTEDLPGFVQGAATLAIVPGAEPRYPGTSVTLTGTFTYTPMVLGIFGVPAIPMSYSLTGEVQ